MQITQRPRRLRKNEQIRKLVRETRLSIDDLIMPLFVIEGKNVKRPIPSMPGIFQLSVDTLPKEIEEISKLRIPAVLLFGIPQHKDSLGSASYNDDGIIQQAVRIIKKTNPELYVITDVCLCEYTDHGHCGPLKGDAVDNDTTLGILARQSVSHAQAGVDMVAPSGMMDGMVAAIRSGLDGADYPDIPIMSYAVKYASSFYGPFREAAECAPKSGDRKSYQMDSANGREALKEVELDIEQGADILMVKPALCYLDIIKTIKERYYYPLAAYNVSGEYAMIKAAAQNGWIDEKKIVPEILTSIKRAGADIIITYFAKQIALTM